MSSAESHAREWYVVQTTTGRERRICELIEKACLMHDEAAKPCKRVRLDECFSPRFKGQKKRHGEWLDVEYPLLPGYVIAVVSRPDLLAAVLRRIDDPCKIVAAGETYVPLSEHERMWIEEQTEKGNRVVPMSFGYREGDKLAVTEGPLKGYEGMISKVDRSNSLAHLEFHVGQMTIKTKVGLGIVPKNE